MDTYLPILSHYMNTLLPDRHSEILKMEKLSSKSGFQALDPASAYFCYLVARMTSAQNVFELGSGSGYSTIWLALAVQENGDGRVCYTMQDAALVESTRQHLTAIGAADLVEFIPGEPLQVLRDSSGPFDLIFNDIEKTAYPAALPVIAKKLRPGGVMLVNNMLWGGRIFNGNDHTPASQAIRRFTLDVMDDPAWIASIIPIGDGLLLAYKQ